MRGIVVANPADPELRHRLVGIGLVDADTGSAYVELLDGSAVVGTDARRGVTGTRHDLADSGCDGRRPILYDRRVPHRATSIEPK